MSDATLSIIILFSQLGAVLLIVAIVIGVRYIFSSSKQTKSLLALVQSNKRHLPLRRTQLEEFYQGSSINEEKTTSNIKTLISDEVTIHGHFIKVALTKSPESLKILGEDIDLLINHYVELLSVDGEKEIIVESIDGKESEKLILKQENSKLKDDISSLESKLQVSSDTIENMLSEFANMYSANDEEKEQTVKNNAYKLHKKIEEEANKKNINKTKGKGSELIEPEPEQKIE